MPQTTPTYEDATGKAERPIVDCLIAKYGENNVSWPIVLIQDGAPCAYLYERNNKNLINLESDNRPRSYSRLRAYYLNYMCLPRNVVPENKVLAQFLNQKYSCSYDYILHSERFSTVDLDYVWYNGTFFKGFEMTTFYVPFDTEETAKNVIKYMNRRPSWQGEHGPQAFHKIVDSARDLGVDYYIVCANTVSKVGSQLKTDGNVYVLKMDHELVDRLASGRPPKSGLFMSFKDFLRWL